MKGHPSSGFRIPMHLRFVLVALAALLLTACGGGGGSSTNPGNSSGVQMSVSQSNVSISATTTQSAPAVSFQVNVTGLTPGQTIYLGGAYSGQGISSLNNPGGALPAAITINFDSPSSLGAGSYKSSVQVKACFDQACTQQVGNSPQNVNVTYMVTQSTFLLNSISPATTTAGGPAFTLTVTGTNFTSQSLVVWNGVDQPTQFDSITKLTAQISAAEIATQGTAPITVFDPLNGTTSAKSFTIQPQPIALDSISPTSVTVGGQTFMLTALGANFSSAAVVRWGNANLFTTYMSNTELIAQIPASDINTTGTASVLVHDPNNPAGITAALTINILPVSIDATSFQMNPAHTGAVNFSSVTFPSNPTWSVDLGATPSYAMIVDGKVIVTAPLPGNSSEILALDQATGNTVWGPIVVNGVANATYDNGRVYILSAPVAASDATLEALDVNTGALDWNSVLTGQYLFTGAPTAADGMLYVSGAGIGGTLYAVDQTTGAVTWTQFVLNGNNSTPAVTADGVYVSYPCQTYDIRPATGELIWNDNTGCEGGGGATPVVANQLDYSPDQFGSSYNGDVFNAETGASDGRYAAGVHLIHGLFPAEWHPAWRDTVKQYRAVELHGRWAAGRSPHSGQSICIHRFSIRESVCSGRHYWRPGMERAFGRTDR